MSKKKISEKIHDLVEDVKETLHIEPSKATEAHGLNESEEAKDETKTTPNVSEGGMGGHKKFDKFKK